MNDKFMQDQVKKNQPTSDKNNVKQTDGMNIDTLKGPSLKRVDADIQQRWQEKRR